VTAREKVLEARNELLNGGGKLRYFSERGLEAPTIKNAYVGYDPARKAFTYPCIAKGGGLLGIHLKGERRDANGKRRQWWEGHADDLSRKGHGKKPDDPAKVIPFGLETLQGLEPGSVVVLCCGEEDALSLRQIGFTALSQPGAGLLEPAFAAEFAGLQAVVFYDAGEEAEARKDAIKLLRAGAAEVRVVEWPPEAPHGADINGRLIEDPRGFKWWVAKTIDLANPVSTDVKLPNRQGTPDDYTTPVVDAPPLPTLSPEALHGLPGEIVKAIEPHTEADPVALLANVLAACGNALGRGAYYAVGAEGADNHYLKINLVLVGETSKGRKGTSWGYPKLLLRSVDPGWVENRVANGLSTGEGLIYVVRDRVVGVDEDGNEFVADEGVPDKRLFVVEGEFASMLKVMARQGNTLSPVIRQTYDDEVLQTMTKNSPMRASETHVTITGHITKLELLRYTTETETANGFANRFMFLLVQRSKELPFGGGMLTGKEELIGRLKEAVVFGKSAGEITWGRTATHAWEEAYGPLSEGKPGLFGAVVGRAEAHTVRLAALYAVMDRSKTIELEHLAAALAFWRYAEASARYIFGDATRGTRLRTGSWRRYEPRARTGSPGPTSGTCSIATRARTRSTERFPCC
jgi:hypothetical protein